MTKKLLKVLLITLAIVFLIVVILFGLGKVTNKNYLESIVSVFKQDSSSQIPEPVVDFEQLEVEYLASNLVTLQNNATFSIKSTTKLKDFESNKYTLYLSQNKEVDGKYWYVIKLNNVGLGEFNQKITLTDVFNSTVDIIVSGKRDSFALPFGLSEISDWEFFSYTANGDSLLALVDKQNKLPLDYYPKELVEVNKDLLLYTNSSDPIFITKQAGEALVVMAKALQKETGKNLVITSGYRSYNEQYRTYAGWVRQLGQEEADKVSARPGFSEHQLATAIDFVDQETGFDLTNNFENGVAGKWLLNNAFKYGFVQSYPSGLESTTGYNHESWHWRFIGINNAKAYKESGKALNEWLKEIKNSPSQN